MKYDVSFRYFKKKEKDNEKRYAVTRDRTRDLQIFSLTLSQLSYPGELITSMMQK
jgi:hypothetical protein